MAQNWRERFLEWNRAQEQSGTPVTDYITPVQEAKAARKTTGTSSTGSGNWSQDFINWNRQQNEEQAGNDINSWISASNGLLNRYGELAGSWRARNDAAYDDFNQRKSRLLSYAGNYRQMYQGNDDAINAINSVVNALSDTDLRGIRDYWSQWDSAEQYNTAKHNYDLYQKYNPYTQEQIDAELAGMDQQNPDRAWLEDYSRQKKYLDLDKNADFAQNSQYESTKKGEARIMPSWDGGAFVTDTGYDDILYDYINRNQDAIDTQNINDINSYATRLGVDKGHLQQMTDDQIARFNYLYKTQSSDAAYEYIKSIEPGLNALNRQKEMAYWEEYAGKHPVISSGLSFVTNLDTTLSFLGQVGDYLEDGQIDQNAGYNRSVYITNTIRGAADKVIQEKWGPVGSFLYQNAMSIGDQVLRTFLSGGYGTGLSKNVVEQLTLLTMASGASASMVVNAKDRGLDETQTIALGVIAGAAEYISEKIGFDALFNANLRADSVKKYLLKNMASEGLEEFVSGAANLVADLSISGDRAEVRIRAEEIARERGISIDEAFGIALGEQALEIGKDMLGGAFSGGLMAGVSSYFGYHSSVDQTADVDNLIRQSLEINPDNQMAKDIQAKFDAKQKVTPVDIDRLQGQYETDYQNAVNNDRELISNAAATRLSDLGETGDVNAIAQAIGKYIQNRSDSSRASRNPSQTNFRSSGLTGAERQLILNSRYGQQVLNELNTNSRIQANEQDRRWTGEIGTRMINPQMYSRFIQNTQTEQTAPAAEQQTAAPISPDAWMEQQLRTQSGQQSVPNAAPATNVGTDVGTETAGATESVAMAGREMPRNTSGRFQNVMPATRMTQANKAVPAAVNDMASGYGNQAAAIRSIYNMGTNKDLTVIAPAIRAAYEIGLNGGLESAAMNASSTRALTPAQRSLAYRVGVAAANKAPKRGNASRKGTVHSDNFKIGGNKYRRMIYNAVNFLAEESGITIEMNDSQGKSVVQGGFNKDTDVLTLDISADINNEEDARKAIKYAALRTFSHELTHFGQKWSSQDYNALTATVLEVMADRYGDEFIEDRIRYWQDRYKNEAGQILSTADAIDEIVAESMTEVLPESQFFEKLIQRSQPTASRLIDALKKFIARLRQYFRNLDTNIRPEVNALMAETEDGTLKYLEGIVEQWDRMMLNAVENYNRAQAEEEAAPATAKAEDIDQKGIQSVQDQNGHEMFNLRTMKQDVDYYMQDLRDAGLVGEGKALSETDLDYLYTSINRVMNYVERNIDAIERKESFREMDGTNRPFLPYKSNSDPHYKMALDYSTLCRKRLLTQAITERLQASLKRALTPVEQVRIRNEIKKLQAEGKKVDVACALCYVEAARLKSPKVINEFLNNKEEALKNYFSLANSRFKNEVYAKRQGDWKESRGLSRTATKDEIKAKGFSVQEFNRFSVQIREQYWDWLRENDPEAYARERAIVDLAESTDNQEFLRADSLARMRRETPELYDAFITKVRQATRSKAQETDVPYARGDINSVSDALIEQMNNESGFRHQSWSDFQAMHLLDTVASIIELSTRKAKVHTYTKVADMVRLLGMTNMAINMSLIPAGETGLNEDGSLAFDPVEGIDYDTMVDLRKEFHKTAGNIAIGITDEQIRALMDSPFIDYIIPYHTSGLNKDMRKRMGIRAWKDYTKYQNEVGSGAKPELHEWFNEREAMAAADGVAYMVEASRKYLQLCHERGLVPKFPQFLQKNEDGSYSLAEDAQNYWKLLIDRKMVDQYDNSVIIQQAVVPKFDVDVMLELLSNEVNSQAAIDAREAEDIIVQKMLDPDRSPFTKAELEQAEKARAVRDAALRFAIDDMREEVDATAQEIENNEYAEEAVQHSLRVTEPEMLNRLNAEMEKGEYDPVTNPDGGYITTYRSYQVIDGGLYPPMNAVDRDEDTGKKKRGYRSEYGVWEMSTESPEEARAYMEKHPGAKYAKFNLDGIDNKTGNVDYAPYLHSSNMVLNDQFSAAYRRNLVVVECRVPVSEMNDAYRAEYAKNGTGWHDWKKGNVAGKLAKLKPEYSREVFLSRYMMPVRQLTDAEVADMYKEYLSGTNLSVPWNVVTPGLRQALENAGVKIDYSDKKIGTNIVRFADTQENVQHALRDYSSMTYAEITKEQQQLTVRENEIAERKRAANNSTEYIDAVTEYMNLVDEAKELLAKRRRGESTPEENERINELRDLRQAATQKIEDVSEKLGLTRLVEEEREIQNEREALRLAADEAWEREGAEKENAAIEKSGLSAPEYFRRKALRAFKTTTNFNEAGYLLPDGRMLNFSGGERNHRYRDHREIGEIYEATSGTAALNRFLNDGNIRVMAESPGIDLAAGVEPTREQYAAIRKFINTIGAKEKQFYIDFSNADGSRADNLSYDGNVNASDILNDIKRFYQSGGAQQRSELMQFHVKYAIRYPQYTQKEINDNSVALQSMSPVGHYTGNELGDRSIALKQRVTDFFNSLGNNVHTEQFGDVALRASSVRSEFRHGNTPPKVVTYAAIPAVLKNGKVIYTINKNSKGLERIVVAAPVTIGANADKAFVAVMLQRDSQNQRLYLHDAVINQESSESRSEHLNSTGPKTANGELYTTDILLNALNVKPQNENSSTVQSSLRTPTYTNRELLEMAANDVSIMGGLTQADRSALEIFKSRLDKLRGFEEQQTEQRRILQELQAAAKPDRDEITRTQNRINILGRKISAAENLVLDVENKQTLKKVLQHARNLAVNQVRRNERALLQERSDVMKYRERVQTKAKRLSDMILKNSDKEHVPAALRGPLADFVASIGFDSRRKMSGGPDTKRDIKYTEALDRLRQIVQNQADYMANPENGSSLDYYLDLPEDFSLLIQEHLNQVTAAVKAFGAEDNNQIFAMDSNELKRLDQILTIINHSVSTINKKFVEGRFARIDQAGQQTIWDMSRRRAFNRSKRAAAISGFFEWKNALPYYAFKRYGEAGQEIFHGIQRGWEKFAFNTQDLIAFTETAYETEEQQAWSNELHKIELEDGSTVQMTTAQIMSLYCLNKREQARGHILGGGVRVGNIEAKQGRRKQTVTQTEPFNMTPDDVKKITDTLTDRQREVADALQEYMNTVGTQWGNEVSMARFGYEGFGEKNYFPIESDQTNLPAKDPDAKANDLFRLLNMSMTKALTPKANNALVVSNIFQVFANHMSDMAKYNALALPVLDAMKWINYKESTTKNENGQFKTLTVQRAIEEAYGQEGMSYFMNFMKDLNGKNNGGRDENGLLARGMSAYKVAAVAANLRVALLQTTAYFRASAVLKPSDMARAVTMNRRQAREERMKYSGISVWKDLGFYDTNIGRNVEDLIMHNETVRDKIADKALWLAEKGDAVTWDVIWNACKLDQQKKGLNGEELMEATAERFMEVIYRTQVVDSTLTRTQLMRDKSIAIKNITGFMSEPGMSYNLLLDAYEEFNTVAQREGKAKAWKATKGTILTAMGAYVASQLVAAIVESIADAARDDDDYESYLDKWLQAFLGDETFLKGNLFNDMDVIGKVPLLKMIPSYLQGYEATDMATQAIKDLSELPAFLKSQSRPTYGKIYKVAQVASRLGGVPIGNAMREFATIWNNTVGVITGQKLKTYTPNDKTVIKEAYEGGKLTEQKAIDELVRRAGMEEKDAKAQVTKWKYSEWDTNGGGLSQEEVAIGLESGNFTEKEKQQIWKDMGYKTDLSKKQESAKAIVEMDDKARVYNSSNWKDGLQDSSLSNSDKDRLVTAYGSDYFAKPYTSLRSAGYSPAEALRLLTAIDADGNGSVKQAEAYAYLQGKSDQQALPIWNSFGWSTSWEKYKARQH